MKTKSTTRVTPPRPSGRGRRVGAAIAVAFIALLIVMACLGYKANRERSRRHFEEQTATLRKASFDVIKSGDDGTHAIIWDARHIDMLADDADCIRNLKRLRCDMSDLRGTQAASAQKLINVYEIFLYDCDGADDLLSAIKGMPSVEILEFNSLRISDDSIRLLGSFPNLKKVIFSSIADPAQLRLLKETIPASKIVIDVSNPNEAK